VRRIAASRQEDCQEGEVELVRAARGHARIRAVHGITLSALRRANQVADGGNSINGSVGAASDPTEIQ
jgi:hypothetical protein